LPEAEARSAEEQPAKLSQAINEKPQASSGAFWKVAGCQILLVVLAIIFLISAVHAISRVNVYA